MFSLFKNVTNQEMFAEQNILERSLKHNCQGKAMNLLVHC